MPLRKYVHWGDHLHKKAPDSTTVTIETERVDRGMLFVASDVTMVNETTPGKITEIGVKRGSDYFAKIKKNLAGGEYSLGNQGSLIIVVEGEQLYGKVYGPKTGDKCVLSFGGELFLRE